MCWRAGGTAKWSGVRMGGARAGGSKTGFVLRNERDVCGCVLCVLCVPTEMEMVAEIGACGSGRCLTFHVDLSKLRAPRVARGRSMRGV